MSLKKSSDLIKSLGAPEVEPKEKPPSTIKTMKRAVDPSGAPRKCKTCLHDLSIPKDCERLHCGLKEGYA